MSRKDEIIDAASELFAEKGYELSMADIAQKVGIKTPSLYSHFESKEEIISLVIEREMTELYDFLNRTIDNLDEESTELKLKKVYVSVFEYFDLPGRLEMWRRLPLIDNRFIKEKCKERIKTRDECFSVKLEAVIEEGVLKGEVKENIRNGGMLLYLAMIQGLLDSKLLYRHTAAEMNQYTMSAWEAYWNGMKR